MSDNNTAAEDALDLIAKVCGEPEWEYPGQVYRDVLGALHARDLKIQELAGAILEARDELAQAHPGLADKALRKAQEKCREIPDWVLPPLLGYGGRR